MKRALTLTTLLLLALAPLALIGEETEADFFAENEAWRAWRIERLTVDTSWLTLVGLDWLAEGDNRLGSAEESELQLPAGKAPARAGVLRLENQKVTLFPDPDSGLTIAGESITGPTVLGTDHDDERTLLEIGSLNFYVIQRGERFGLRIRDRQANLRTHFPGLDYFPADPRFRVEATFTPHPEGTTRRVANVLGQIDEVPSPGKLSFTLDGVERTLTALDDTGDGRLFLIVGDKTNGVETYGAGRYAYTDPPKAGKVILDLNRLYNMPCAFTEFSTCQLPPRENRLPIRLETGEKKFAKPDHP
jgi:uncharacterized protein (DUF1684 family)